MLGTQGINMELCSEAASETAGNIWAETKIKLPPEESRISYYLENFGHCYFHRVKEAVERTSKPYALSLQSICLLVF